MDTTPTGGIAASTGMASSTYADSVDSSPRSRGGEPWDEQYPSSTTGPKLRLMCSYGGHIVPRPHDRSLCYLGGETRIVVVERHAALSNLSAKLSRSLLAGRPFTLKYQLPSEDLDSLISVTTDEDLENMIEEYDRIVAGASGKASRLRLFLFPVKVDSPSPSSSSIGSLVDDSKSESWFVDALNGAIGMGGVLQRGLSGDSGTSSVNCLLGLEDEQNPAVVAHPVANASGASSQQGGDLNNHQHLLQHNNNHHSQLPRPDSSGKLKQGQEVHSVPDSPMMDTTSSFGSTSSAPSLSHLPPIRVRPDDQSPDKRGFNGEGLDEHFSQMNLQKQDEGFKDGGLGGVVHHQHVAVAVPMAAVALNPPPPVAPVVPIVTSVVATAATSPTENPNHAIRAFSSDDEKSEQLGLSKPPQVPLVQQQKTNNAFDISMSDRPVHYQEKANTATAVWSTVSDVKQEVQSSVSDRGHMQVSEQGHALPAQPDHPQQQQKQQQQKQQLQPQQQQQQQQHYIHAAHLVQHHPSNTNSLLLQHPSTPMIPIQPYYQMHHPIHPQQQLPHNHPYNSQIPMYLVPVQPNTAYAVPVQQPNLVDGTLVSSSAMPSIPVPHHILPPRGVAPQKSELAAANIHRTSAATASTVPQSSSAPQLIHLGDQTHQFISSYHPVQHHPSQSAAASAYGYEFSNPLQSQQMFYTQATSSPLPSHLQTISSGTALISDAQPQLQQQPPPDVKQTRAAS